MASRTIPAALAAALLCAAAAPLAAGPGPAATASVVVEAGRVAVRPEGAERSMEVTGAFSLYAGDGLLALPGSRVTVRVASGEEVRLPPGLPCVVTAGGVVTEADRRLLAGLPSPVRREAARAAAPTTVPDAAPAPALAGAVTPVEGEAHLKERDWRSWVRIPHRTSFGWGARINAAPHARLEVTLADGTLLRLEGPAHLQVEAGSVELTQGTMLAQVGREDRLLIVDTPAARVRLVGTLLEVVHLAPPGETTIRVHAGVARLESPAAAAAAPWARFLSAGRESAVALGSPPRPSVRFDKRLALERFTEGWKPEGPGESILPDPAQEDLLRQLRADQAPLRRPTPAQEVESRESRGAWLRLRMEAMESTANRRTYQAFRRYADARTRRERAEGEAPPDAVAQAARPQAATGEVPGGQSPDGTRGKLRLLRWYERRTAQRLDAVEVDLANQDLEAASDPGAALDFDRRSLRERLYGQDLRLQTRRLLPVTRQRLTALGVEVADLSAQIRTLSTSFPVNQALIDQLSAQRAGLLQEADQLKDSLEELIELH